MDLSPEFAIVSVHSFYDQVELMTQLGLMQA